MISLFLVYFFYLENFQAFFCLIRSYKESFTLNIDNIALLWLRVWGTLNDSEKELVILFVENGKMDWTTLTNKVSYSNVTLTKYLDLLSNKGIINTLLMEIIIYSM